MVTDAAGLGINALFVQAVRRGDCLCLLSSVPAAADIQKGFDPLAEVVRLAHARRIRVIGWVSVTGAWNSTLPSAGPIQVFAQHGPAARESWLSRRPDGSWQSSADAWLDPGIPAAADHMVRSAVGLVRAYDLDGLQLDRIRYPDGGDWGYSPVTLARYRLETGQAGIPAAADHMVRSAVGLVRAYDLDGLQLDRIRYPDGGDWGYSPVTLERYRMETGQAGVPAPADERWRAWKREQVTMLTRRIALEARALKPGVIISAATIVYGDGPADLNAFYATRSYSEVLQDWPAWMGAGLLDLNVIMNYKRDGVGGQEGWFDRWNAFAASQRAGTGEVAAGTSMYLNPPQVTASQAGRALPLGLGWVGYAYRTPTNEVYRGTQTQPQGLASLKTVLAAAPGVLDRPPAWNPVVQARRALLGRVLGNLQVGSLQLGGQAVSAYDQGGTLLGTVSTDGNGYYGFPDLPAGRVEVRVAGQSWAEELKLGVTRFPNLLLRPPVPAGP